MDKTTEIYSKNSDFPVHVTQQPEGIDSIHTVYGLWIFGAIRNSISPARETLNPRLFRFYGISQLLEGRGWRWTGQGGRQEFGPGSFIITTPGLIHDYGGLAGAYREDAISFSGPVADSLFNAGILEEGIFFTGSDRKLLSVIELSMNPSRESQMESNIRLQELLVGIHHMKRETDSDRRESVFKDLLGLIRDNPGKWWQVKEMARFCSLSEGYFRSRFQEITGVSPKQYIDSVKIKLACEMLAGMGEPVENIALKLGYVDPLHFSRRFKSFTGLSPRAYRISMSRN